MEINIQDTDTEDIIKYSIYSFGADTLNDLVASGFTDNSGLFTTTISLPNYLEKVYVVAKTIKGSLTVLSCLLSPEWLALITQPRVAGAGRHFSSQEGCTEVLYAVNSKGQFFYHRQ